MNKTLIAAATLLAAAGAAQAQEKPTVSMFGLIDLNVSRYGAGSKSGAKSDVVLNDGTANGLNGTRWGLKASQDLGEGLKVGALYEGGFTANNGNLAQGGRIMGRQVYLSLAHANVGELRLGRQYILEDSVMGQTNPFGNALTLNPGTGVTDAGKSLPMWLNAPRADNVIQLQTLNYSGFTAAAQVAPVSGGTADRFHGVKLAYATGPVSTAMSYEWNKSRSTGDKVNKSMTLGANYNFGVFKLLGGVQRNRDLVTTSVNGAFTGNNLVVTGPQTFTANQTDGYTLGAEMPVNKFLLGTNYTLVKYGSAAGDSQKLGKVAVGARYALAENTFVYSSLSMATGDLKDYISEKSVVQAGLRFAF